MVKGATSNTDIDERKLRLEERRFDEEMNQRRLSNEIEEKRLKKTDPLTLAVIGGLIAAFSSIGVSLLNGRSQLELEREKHKADMVTEAYRAEAGRILEAIKFGDPDRTACTLKFMIKGGLIQTASLRDFVDLYLLSRNGGSGVGVDMAAAQQPPSSGVQTAAGSAETPGCQPAPTTKTATIGQTDPTDVKPISTQGPLQLLNYASDWMGGGHNQNEACAHAIAQFQEKFPGKVLQRVSSDEASRKDFLGHVTYRYFCTVGVFENPSTK